MAFLNTYKKLKIYAYRAEGAPINNAYCGEAAYHNSKTTLGQLAHNVSVVYDVFAVAIKET